MPLFGPPNVEKLKAKRDVKGLINALGYQKDATVRQAAAEALGQIGDPQAVEPLTAALKDAYGGVRQAAAEALGQIGGTRAAKPLIAALKDKGVHQAAIKALIKIGAPAAEPLVAALKNKDTEVKQAAAELLGEIGDKRAVEPLIAALKDKDVQHTAAEALVKIGAPALKPLIITLKDQGMSQAAIETLDKLGWQPDQSEAGAIYWIAKGQWDKCVEIGLPAVKPLTAAVQDNSEVVRRAAAEALGKIGDARAVEPLIACLEDRDIFVQQIAAEALRQVGAPAVEMLKDTLEDSIKLHSTIWKLKQIGALDAALCIRAVEKCLAALKNEYSIIRDGAAHALKEIGAPAVEPLIAALTTRDMNLRQGIAEALVKIGAPAVKPLIAAFESGNEDVRKAIAEVLKQIGAPAIELLTAALKDEKERRAAAGILGRIGWQPDRSELGAICCIERREWRKCVEIGAPAVEPLVAALKDKDWAVCQAAAEALDILGWQPDSSEVGAAYWIAKREWDKCVEIGASAVEPLIAALEDKSEHVRRGAARALGQTGDTRAVGALFGTLWDQDWDVRQTAAEVLVNLYHKGSLDEQTKQSILARRERIIEPHTDVPDQHDDEYSKCGFRTSQWTPHQDYGIGVDFPL